MSKPTVGRITQLHGKGDSTGIGLIDKAWFPARKADELIGCPKHGPCRECHREEDQRAIYVLIQKLDTTISRVETLEHQVENLKRKIDDP